MPRPVYDVTLAEKKTLAHNTIQLSLSFNNEVNFQYIAGQFVQLLFKDDEKEHKRSYSIANSPLHFKQTGLLEIVISFVEGGVASKLFKTISRGFTMALVGPFGVLTLPNSIDGQLILAGTGTGVAPYHAMVPDLEILAQQTVPIVLITGARYKNDRIYHEKFQEISKKHSNLHYKTCLSRETIDFKNNEYKGYIQEQFTHININAKKDLVYLCGNPAMVDEAASILKEAGLSSKQIKREKYVYSGH